MPATTAELEQPVGPFGATAGGVASLVPQAVIETASAPVDPRTMVVTVTQVQGWLRELSGRVLMRVPRWTELAAEPPAVGTDPDGTLYVNPAGSEVGVDEDGVLYLDATGTPLPTDRSLFLEAARDAVHNGAASYLQAARHPERAAVNADSYSAVLWARFLEALTLLDEYVAGRLPGGDTDPAIVAAATGATSGSFPPVIFGDARGYIFDPMR